MAKQDPLVGRTIKAVRKMTDAEMDAEGWDGFYTPTVVVFDDGSTLYPSQDLEGNGPGALFGTNAQGIQICVMAR